MFLAYEHVDRETRFITTTLPAIHAEMKRLEQKAGDGDPVLSETNAPSKPSLARTPDADLAMLTGGMDDRRSVCSTDPDHAGIEPSPEQEASHRPLHSIFRGSLEIGRVSQRSGCTTMAAGI